MHQIKTPSDTTDTAELFKPKTFLQAIEIMACRNNINCYKKKKKNIQIAHQIIEDQINKFIKAELSNFTLNYKYVMADGEVLIEATSSIGAEITVTIEPKELAKY